MSRGDLIQMMNTGKEYQLDEVGVLAPHKVQVRTGLAMGARDGGEGGERGCGD